MENNQSKEEAKVFVKPPPAEGSPQWCMKKYGTICFSTEFMKRHIGYGAPVITPEGEFTGFNKREAPTNLSLEVWLGFVPEKFRTVAMELTREIAEDLKASNGRADQESLDKFIATMAKRFDEWFEANQ